ERRPSLWYFKNWPTLGILFCRFLFVGISATAKIPCSSKEKLEGGGFSVYWYRRREGEGPTCIKKCLNDENVSKFACKPETHGVILEIYNAQQKDSGDYYCAVKSSSYLIFDNGSTLIVGGDRQTVSCPAPYTLCNHDRLYSSEPVVSASSPGFDNGCFQYVVPLAVGGALVLLMVSLSLVWIFCLSTRGNEHSSSQKRLQNEIPFPCFTPRH
uniref:Ig-like domain-containing protein n=1 Tax=Chelonoidis abingdonii TaxID=106734 RepID=A0A8C0GYJ4_CHEAB